MTRALTIVDEIAMKATWAIPDAISADIFDGDKVLADPTPTHLIEGLEAAAVILADQAFLDLFDQHTAGRIGPDFDFSGHYDDVVVSFANRMYSTLRLLPMVRAEWLWPCSSAIGEAFRERINRLGASGPGGWA